MGQWTYSFNRKQLLIDIVKVTIACVIAAAGHPFIAIFIAAVHLEARQ